MPKVVDHVERRRELAEAVWRVILRDGIEGVSVRNVAVEADCSTGALRHYFGTKEELLSSATQLLEERAIARFTSKQYDGTPREAIRAVLCEILPLDEERRTEGDLWFAFAARSLVDPRISKEHGPVFDGAREVCVRITRQMAEGGWLYPGLEPDVEAARLHALIDGLAMHMLMRRVDEREAISTLDAHLVQIIRDVQQD